MEDSPDRRDGITGTDAREHLERVSDAVFALDSEFRFTYLNREAESVLERDEGELLGENVWDEFPAAVGTDFQRRYERALREMEEVTFSEYYEPLDAWFEASAYPSESGLTVYFRDVTERRKRELRRRREEFTALVEDVEEYAIFRLDPEGRVASWNRGAEAIKGYEQEEILGEHVSTFYTDEAVDAGRPAEFLARAAADGQAKAEEWRVRKGGTRFWASVVITALRDDGGSLRGYTKVVRDMTERKRRERRLEAVFNRTFQFTGLLEPDGTVIKVNDAAVEFSGSAREELVGRPFWEVPWWGTDEQTVAGLRDAVGWAAAGEFVRYEVTAGAPDGAGEVTVDFSISPVTDETGDVVLLVPEGRDVTERKRRERELRRERERLEFVNRVLRHNLLNGLNVVSARADILEAFVSEGGETHLGTIRGRVEELVDLVETMRSFTRVIGQEVTDLEPVDLGSTLARQLEALDDVHDDVVVVAEGTLPSVSVLADELLPQVFENVLTNAVQHNDKDAPRVTVRVDRGEDDVAVRVSDNGPGVPDEEKDRIVEKSVEELSTPGGGFGLFLAKELVDSYGGSIDVADNDPEGAVFTVTLRTA
jgi:PAS domain S-box-containing protein